MKNTSVIYKYRTWDDEFHRDVLQKNELYFSSPASINDPFDFQTSPDLSQLDTDLKRELFINKMLNEAAQGLRLLGINPDTVRKESLKKLKFSATAFQNEYDELNSKWTNARFGVISFSYRWDSILMWTHYAKNHKGFCVGFSKAELERSTIIGTAGPATYTDIFPPLDPLEENIHKEIFLKTHTKAKDWAYEEEYRITNLWSEHDPSIADRKVNFPDNFISEIILGYLISPEHKREILQIAEAKNVPVYQITKKNRSFLFDKVKL